MVEPEYRSDGNFALFGASDSPGRQLPPLVTGLFGEFCSLSLILYEIMSWNRDAKVPVGGEHDLLMRRQFYDKVRRRREDLPRRMREDINFTPQTCFLR
jgi:hypothetical protein